MLVVATTPDVRTGVTAVLHHMAAVMNGGDDIDIDSLVKQLGNGAEATPAEFIELAQREADFRLRVVRDFGALTAPEVAALTGSAAGNRSQRAYRLRRDGRIFGVPFQGQVRYLGFQFDAAGEPLPVVRDVLRALVAWA